MRFPVSLALILPRGLILIPEQKRGWRRSGTRCQSSADRTPWERESVSREMVCHGARMTERPGDFGVTDFVALGKAGTEFGKT